MVPLTTTAAQGPMGHRSFDELCLAQRRQVDGRNDLRACRHGTHTQAGMTAPQLPACRWHAPGVAGLRPQRQSAAAAYQSWRQSMQACTHAPASHATCSNKSSCRVCVCVRGGGVWGCCLLL